MAKKKKTGEINPNSFLGRYIEASGGKTDIMPTKQGWKGAWENQRQKIAQNEKQTEKNTSFLAKAFRAINDSVGIGWRDEPTNAGTAPRTSGKAQATTPVPVGPYNTKSPMEQIQERMNAAGARTKQAANEPANSALLDNLIYGDSRRMRVQVPKVGTTARGRSAATAYQTPAGPEVPAANTKPTATAAPAGTATAGRTMDRNSGYRYIEGRADQFREKLIGNEISRMMEEQQKQQQQYKEEYEKWLMDTDSTYLSGRADREYKRELINRQKQEIEDRKAYYDDPGSMKERKRYAEEYRRTPQGEVRWLLDNRAGTDAAVNRIRTIMAQNPDAFPAREDMFAGGVDFSAGSWWDLNNPGSNISQYFDQYAPRMGSESSADVKNTVARLSGQMDMDKELESLDKADEKWGEINRIEENVPEADDDYQWRLVKRQMTAAETRLAKARGDEPNWSNLLGVHDDLDKAYVIVNNKLYYQDANQLEAAFQPLMYMQDDQIETFNKYYNSGMRDEAKAYLDALMPFMNADLTKHYTSTARELAKQGNIEGALAGTASIGFNVIGGLTGTVGTVAAFFGDRNAQDPNSPWYLAGNVTGAIRDERGQVWDDGLVSVLGEGARGVGRFFNGVAYSIADNVLARYLGGGVNGAQNISQGAVQLIMSAEVVGQDFVQNMGRGMDVTEAALMAIGSGAIEALTEKYSLEALLNADPKDMLSSWRKAARYIGKNVLAEGSEEAASDVLNMIMDKAFSVAYGNMDEISLQASQYVEKMKAENPGYTQAQLAEWQREGERQAWQGFWKDVGMSALAGGVSGGLQASSRAGAMKADMLIAGRNVRSADSGSKIDRLLNRKGGENSRTESKGAQHGENAEYLLKIGEGMDKESEAYKLSQKLKGKEKISNFELGRLAMNISQSQSEEISRTAKETMQQEIQRQLQSKGVDAAEARFQSGLVYRAATQGVNALNKSERRQLLGNDFASKLYMELATPSESAEKAESPEAFTAALDARMAARQATAGTRQSLRAVSQMMEGRSAFEQTAARKVGRDGLKKAAESVTNIAAEDVENTLQMAGGDEAVQNRTASTVVVYSGAEGGNEARVGKIVGFDNGKVKVRYADGTEATTDAKGLETTDTRAQKIVGLMTTTPGMMTGEVAAMALETLDSMGDEASDTFAEDVLDINLNARLGWSMPANISIKEDAAQRIYDQARSEYEAAEENRLEKDGMLQPGKGRLHAGDIRYGTKEFNKFAEDKHLTKEQKDQLYVANIFAETFGFDIDVFEGKEFTDKEGRKLQEAGYQTKGQIGLNIAGKAVALGGEEFSLNILNAIGHEGSHWLQKHSKSGYRQMVNFAMRELQKSGGYDLAERIQEKIQEYNRAYQSMGEKDAAGNVRTTSFDDAVYEIVSDSFDQIMSSEEMAERLKKEAPEAHKGIKEWVRTFITRLSNAIKGIRESGSYESRMIRTMGGMKAIDEMARIWLGAYDEVIHGVVTQAEVTAMSREEAKTALNEALGKPEKSFSFTETVEARTDGLVAMHNLSAENLEKQLGMGGMAGPSIAMIAEDAQWDLFGDVSLFLSRDVAERAIGKGRAYSGDAFTPVITNKNVRTTAEAMADLRSQSPRRVTPDSLIDAFSNYKTMRSVEAMRKKAHTENSAESRAQLEKLQQGVNDAVMDAVIDGLHAQGKSQEEIGRILEGNYKNIERQTARGALFAAEEIERQREAGKRNWEIDTEGIIGENIARELKEYLDTKGFDLENNDDLDEAVMAFINAAEDMLGSGMQEIKPDEVVGFGDVQAVELPDNAPQSLVDALVEAGVPEDRIYRYENGNKADRARVANGIKPGVSFSIQERVMNPENLAEMLDNGELESIPYNPKTGDIRYSIADKRTRDILGGFARYQIWKNEENKEKLLKKAKLDSKTIQDIMAGGVMREGSYEQYGLKGKDIQALELLDRDTWKWQEKEMDSLTLDEDDLDARYIDAWRRGDREEMERLLMEQYEGTDGLIAFKSPAWYDSARHRWIANAIKEKNPEAIATAAWEMSRLVPKNAVLVPMPPHTGKVTADTDTMVLANKIAEFTGCPVINALEGNERESRKESKEKSRAEQITAEDMGFRQIAEIPEGTIPYFIDNVIGSGTTAQAAHDALGAGLTLAYAKSTRSAIPGLKRAEATFIDRNQEYLIPLSARGDMEKAGVKGLSYSFRETDGKYMDAVNNNDMEAAQQMVDQTAEEALKSSKVRGKDGKLVKVFHGTKAEFNEFRRDMIGSTGRFEGSGFNFTPYEGRASSYGKKVLAGYLNIENPLSAEKKTISISKLAQIIRQADPTGDWIISDYARNTRDYGTTEFVRREAMTAARNIWESSDNDVDIYSFISAADSDAEGLISTFEKLGYDGLIHYDDNGNIKTAVAFSSNQFKLADPVTYDDDGNVIPLSERFNEEKKDIRYSINSVKQTPEGTFEDAEGNAVAQEIADGVISAYSADFSIRTVNQTVDDDLIEKLVRKGFSRKKVNQWVKDVRGIAKMIADDAQRLDFKAIGGKMLKNNQEYIKTLDSSTLCAKRLLYQGIFNQIQHMLPNTPLLPEDLIKLTNMMKERGMVTPCSICYVESRRRMLGEFASRWLKEYDGVYKPRIEEVTTTDGLEALRNSEDPAKRQAAQDFEDAMNAKGSANPKLVQLRSEYQGEIKDLTDRQIKKVKEIGGLRVQSFSDFETVHLLDMMQAVMDMAAKDLTSQAYTKVPNFAWVFGDTGIKINLSLIGEGTGLDENGNLVFSSTEGMDFEEAMKLRSAYSKNVGTILVGMNDEHIIAAMGDDRIDFIIPFHKSGWSKKEMSLMIGMGTYKDFTRWQNEKLIARDAKGNIVRNKNGTYKTVPGKTSHLVNLEPVGPNGYWNFNKDGTWNAEKYLKLCKQEGRLPKFYQFLTDNGDGSFSLPTDGSKRSENIRKGYWKMLIDFKMYDNDGKGSPQTEVEPNFNMEAARRILDEYEGGADTLPTNDSLAKSFVDEYKAAHPGRKEFSIKDTHPDNMDVRVWMDSMSESSLNTEAEKSLLRSYKDLRMAIEVARERQRNYSRRIEEMEAKKDSLTPQEKRLLQGLKIRLENAKATQAAHEAKLEKVTGDEGFARMMHDQQQLINDYTQGKTQDEVIAAVTGMEDAAKSLQGDIARTAEELQELAGSQRVKQIRAHISGQTLDSAATRIRRNYNSTINKTELSNGLAQIRLMIAANQDPTEAIEELAGRILDRRKASERNNSLDQLRGLAIRLGDSQLKEIYGSDSSLREIRRMMAGSGVKVERAADGTGGLDGNWSELVSFVPALDHYNGYDTDNALNQAKAVAEFVQNAVEEQRNSGRAELEDQMAEIIMDLTGEIATIDLNIPSDPKAREAIRSLSEYVSEMAEKANIAGQKVAELEKKLQGIVAEGRKASNWSRAMKADVQQTIDYFNKTAKMAVDEAKRQKQDAIIQQLKDKHIQDILKKNDEWRALIQRDADARKQADKNALTRRKMTTVVGRLSKLLSSPTNTKNVPEVVNPLARKLMELIVSADLSEGGRKISNINRKDLQEMKRRLDAWNARDGVYDPESIADENIRDKANLDLDTIEQQIKRWNDRYSGKNKLDTLRQMGDTLSDMQEAVSEIYSIIQREREIALGDRRVAVTDQAAKVKYQTFNKKAREWTGKLGKAIAAAHRGIISGNMTPEYFFRTIGNSGLSDLWEEYHRAENRNGLELLRSRERMAQIAEEHGYQNWDTKATTEIQLENGGKVTLTLGQMMSLWATWNREQTLGPEMSQHLEIGGFYAEQDTRQGIVGKATIEKRAHRVTAGDMAKIGEILTTEQKSFIDDVVRYMSTDMSQLGNEASMKAYGIKMYKEKYYFPFQMWDGIKSRKSNDAGAAAGAQDRAFHPSFSKTRMHGANNSLIIGDFMQTSMDHIVGMINYATMGLANDTFQKVLNATTYEGEGENATKRNIRAVLEEAYGKESMDYLRDLQNQLNGGAVQTRKSMMDRAVTLFRKNAVAGSLSVALQQPLSYLRASLMINPKYLTKAIGTDIFKGAYQEMLQHSGVAVIKDMGRFDMNFGQSAREFITPDGKEGGARKAWDKVTKAATILPEKMDQWTWTRMWVAVKQEQKAAHPEMDTGSDEFLDMCGERFNDIMRRTQVYDSVLVKSRNMRSDNYAIRNLTSFMAEPTLTANVLADAVREAASGVRGAKGRMAGAAGVYLLSAVLQAAVKGVMGAGRNPDEEKTFLENFAYRFYSGLLSETNVFNLIPGYGDLITLLKQGELSDDAMGAIGKLFTAGKTGVDLLLGNAKKGPYRAVEDSAAQILQLFTKLPAKNLMRDARAMYNFITQPYAKRETSGAVIKYQAKEQTFNADNLLGVVNKWLGDLKAGGYQTNATAYYQRIYDAEKAGDTQAAEDMREFLMLGKGVKEKSIDSGIKKLANEEGNTDYMLENGMDAGDLIRTQLRDGTITAEEARKQLQANDPDKDADSIWWAVDRIEYQKETGNAASGTYYRLWDAMNANKADEISTAIDSLLAHGGKAENIRKGINGQYKEAYKEAGNSEKVKIRDAMQKAYRKLGYSAEDANKTISKWK